MPSESEQTHWGGPSSPMQKMDTSQIYELFVKHAKEIGAFIRKRGSDEQDVDDIVQESFIRLAQYAQADSIQNPRAFLFRTAANISVDLHRHGKVRQLHAEPDAEVDLVADTTLSPDRYWESQDSLEQLTQWLEELPELQRHAFMLYCVEGCTIAEIAARLKLSRSSVERYTKAAMFHVSKCLSAAENPND